jgi:hypothetical protein
MAGYEERPELANSLATGDLTVSHSYVLQGEELENLFNSFSAKSPLPSAFLYWKSLLTSNRLPSRRDVDPTNMEITVLPSIVMLDVEEVPQRRFRYRLVGTEVSGIFGADYTGRYLDEMGLGEVFARVAAFYSLICNDPRPAMLKGSYETQSGLTFNVDRLAMPLSDDGSRVSTLFCVFEKT